MRILAVAAALCFLVTAADTHAAEAVVFPKLGVQKTTETFKSVGDVELKLHIFDIARPGHAPTPQGRTAIVFFFGGGWRSGTTTQFEPHAKYFATRGAVAITPEYRVNSKHKSTIAQSVSDAKSAMRWVRRNAERLGIDPKRVVAGGGSAGGHLAAAVATLPGFNADHEDTSISCRPDALLLFNPAVDLRAEGFGANFQKGRHAAILARMGTTPEKISPTLHVPKSAPPAIIFHGVADPTVPYAQAVAFEKAWSKHGPCVVKGYEGQEHGFFNLNRNNEYFGRTVAEADRFLLKHEFLNGEPTIDKLEAAIRSAK